MNPQISISLFSLTPDISISPLENSRPNSEYIVFLRLPSPDVSSLTFPSTIKVNAISGFESATFSTIAVTAIASVISLFRNLRRAGTFANRFSTIIDVPTAQPRSVTPTISPKCAVSMAPNSESFVFDIILISETEEIAANASPRNPSVMIELRSFSSRILLVA